MEVLVIIVGFALLGLGWISGLYTDIYNSVFK